MASINDFRSAIASGVQRQHKWRVFVNFPTELGVGSDTVRETSLLATSTSTPTSQIGVVELGWGGRIVPVPGDRNYSTELTLTFIATNSNSHYASFVAWSNLMNSYEGNAAGTSNPYADVELQLLDAQDNVTQQFFLKDAFPVTVGELALDAASQDSFATFDVALRYVHFSYSKDGTQITS